MLTYFLPDYNNYKIRTKQLPSGSNYMRVDVQNMLTNDSYSFLANPGQWSYDQCESIVDISFNLDIALNVNVGDEYRIFLTPAITSSTTPFTYLDPVWHGSLQVFASQSVDKPAYINQIPLDDQRISRDSTNEFIYWDQTAPFVPTTTIAPTTTTTLAPTTTTIAPTTTTTIAPTTTTTTITPGVNANFYFNDQFGGQGFDVCAGGTTDGTIPFVSVIDYHLLMSSDAGCTTPYGTVWSKQSPSPSGYALPTFAQIPCTSGGPVQGVGNLYRTRVSGSLTFDTPAGTSPAMMFDISGSGFQDLTFSGYTLRVNAAGCVLNNPALGCP